MVQGRVYLLDPCQEEPSHFVLQSCALLWLSRYQKASTEGGEARCRGPSCVLLQHGALSLRGSGRKGSLPACPALVGKPF